MIVTFYDKIQKMEITMWVKDELDAWKSLADNFGSMYVLENIAFIGKNIF